MEVQRRISYSFRVSETLMAEASRIAAAKDEKMAQVIRNAIRNYIDAERKGHQKRKYA